MQETSLHRPQTGTMRAMRAWRLSAAAALALAACSNGLNIRVPVPANPAQGPVVRLTTPLDRRTFTTRLAAVDRPRLPPDTVNDPEVRRRAIGIWDDPSAAANTYASFTMGEVLLPKGRSVEALTSELITRGFREAGYRVVDPKSLRYPSARQVNTEIIELWCWYVGGNTNRLRVKASFRLTGLPKVGEAIVEGRSEVRAQPGAPLWGEAFGIAFSEVLNRIKDRLAEAPSGVAPKTRLPSSGTPGAPRLRREGI